MNCHPESRCKTQDDYIPTKRLIKNPDAAQALMKAIKGTTIYKHAKDFAKVMHVMEPLCDTCHKEDR